MSSPDEKQAFAARLKQALTRNPKKILSATELALQFNLRHPNGSVTAQAVQKWLSGKAQPAIDKIDTLAEWLNVSAQWLRFGIAEKADGPKGRRLQTGKTIQVRDLTADELKLLARIRGLSEHRRYLVGEIVEQFALEDEIWRE